MEDPKSKIEDLLDHVKDYFNTSAELIELKSTQKMATILSSAFSNLIILLFILLFFLFANLAFAYYISTLTGKIYLGFLVVAGGYLFIGIILWAGKDKFLTKPILNGIIKQIFKERNEEQD